TQNAAGLYFGVTIDVSDFTGMHTLSLGVEVFEQFGAQADGKTHFDNLQIPGPGVLPLAGLFGLSVNRRRPNSRVLTG
ncbi:MAG: hypothetical protein ACYS0D_07925, partial [Planctomycetota bacterium]